MRALPGGSTGVDASEAGRPGPSPRPDRRQTRRAIFRRRARRHQLLEAVSKAAVAGKGEKTGPALHNAGRAAKDCEGRSC